MRKKIFLLVLILFALIAVKSPLDLPVSAATGGTTGQCTWSLDGTVLTISGNGAMANYSDTFLPPWYDSASAITQLYINEGVTSIGDYSFAGCTSLTAIILPNGSLNRIGNGAFLLCYSTDYFAVPASVTELGVSVFAGCYNLQNLLTVAGNPIYASSGNCIIERASGTVVAGCPTSVIPQDTWVNTIGEGAFMLHYGASSLFVPGNITTIGEGAFYGLQSSVTLSEGLKTIGAYAFSESNLSYVYLPSSLEEIGEGAFMYCLNINGLSLPEGIKSIGADAYFGCNFKNAVTIPKSVQFIGESAFSANPDLPGFNLAADHPYFTAAGNCLVEKATGTLITGCSNSTIFSGEGVRSIGDYAFAYTNISSIQIPDGITSIGEGAFIGCENLKAVRIPGSITSIGEYAFANCTNFTELSLSGTIPTFPTSSLENTPHANRTAKIWYEGTPQDLEGAQLDFTMGIWHYVENSCKTSCTECSAQRSVHFDHRYASLCDETCDACAITRKVNADHTFDDSCDELCNKCRFEREAHVFSDPCDTECNVCASTRAPNHYTVIPVPAHTTENCPSYPFTSNEGWYQSTNKDHNSTSTFSIIATHRCSFTVTCRFSCEVEHDYLHIRRNALDVWGGSGTGGQPYSVPVSLEKGDVLTISYSKDGSGSKGDDCIWFTLSCGCEDTIQVPSSELEASCGKAVLCSGCGETVKSALDHSYSFECDKSCNLCGFVREASHKYDGPCDISCNICQQKRFAPHYFDHSQDLICNLCSYERSPYVPGDVNGVEGVDMDDAIYTLFHCSFPEDYPVNQDPDFDSNGEIDMDDAIYLLFYCSFPEDYPLIPWLWPLPAETSGSVSFPSGKPTDGIRIDVGGWEYNGIIPALAAADGIVTEAKYFSDRGNHVTVDHGNGYLTYYSHLNSISVSVGDKVSQGDTLGMLGATGMTSPDNVNLYFVLLMPDGKGGESIRVNPLNYVFLPPSIEV